ncbi:hypothetical protein [Nonomuraea sp. NPDC048916]|uniref:hypothetical protein n=1 Tax=Nonomuraea sp. NPDC048916 TaxID=3154232 RepID=UPI00341107F2
MPEPGGVRDPKPAPDTRQVAAELVRTWNAAADRAFSVAVHQPDVYLRTTRLVAAVVRELRERGRGAEPLVEAWREHRELVRRVADSSDLLTLDGLDVDEVAGAAFTMRYREVLEEITLDDRLAALAEAAPDAGWLVLEESGYRPGDPFVPYRRLEVEPATGRALLVTTRPNETFTACVHTVERGHIDLETGRLASGDPGAPGDDLHEVASSEEREALVARVKGSDDAAHDEISAESGPTG